MVCSFGPSIIISAECQRLGEIGIRDFIVKNNLDAVSEPVKRIVNTPKSCNEKTLTEYYARWHELKLFAFLRGDYQSAALLDRLLCPRNPLPLRPELIVEYYQYKIGELKEKLFVCGTQIPALDVENNEMTCLDQWHCKTSLQKLKSAIYALHDAYTHLRGKYMSICKDCLHADSLLERKPAPNQHEKLQPGTYGACQVHAGRPLLIPKGNCATAHEVVQAHNVNCTRVANWVRKGSIQILPGEVRQLRDYLTSSGRFTDFQTYVMIIIGIKLFLRADELLSMRLEHFPLEYQIVDKHRIKSIAVKIKGKSDLNEVHLHLYCDNECTEFCPVRHLMVYVAWSGITEGLLFPDKYYFNDKLTRRRTVKRTENPDDEYKILYSDWLSNLRYLFKFVLKREVTNGRLGTHTLRKTAYLFAVWGVLKRINANSLEKLEAFEALPDLLLSQVLGSARHKSITNANTYQMDSATLYAMVVRENNAEHHKISNWSPIFFNSFENASTIAQPSVRFQKPLHLLAVFFIEVIVQIEVNPEKISIKEAIELVRKHNTIVDKESELNQILAVSCTEVVAKNILRVVEQRIQQQIEQRSENMYNLYRLKNEEKEIQAAILPLSSDMLVESTEPVFTPAANLKKLTKKETNILDIPERYVFYNLHTTMDKLNIIIKLYNDGLCAKTKDMVYNAKSWYLKNVPRIYICVQKCHNGDLESFCTKVGHIKFKSYNYKCNICGDSKKITEEL